MSGRVHRRQAEKFAERDADIAATRGAGYAEGVQSVAPAPAEPDVATQIKQLADLKDQGILTEEEFATKKKQLLGI